MPVYFCVAWTAKVVVNNLRILTRDSESGTNWRCTLKSKVKYHLHADVSWKLLASLPASLHHKWVSAYKPQFDKHVHCTPKLVGQAIMPVYFCVA